MRNLNIVTKIKYLHDRVFRITFDDGLEGEVDFSEYIGRGPVFEPLRDESFFRNASIEGGTIAWPNGADIAPETLYEKIEKTNNASNIKSEVRSSTTENISLDSPQACYSSEKLLIEEFNQAWYHYRHLESNRTAYLRFLFMILAASAAFATIIMRDNPALQRDLIGLLFAICMWVFFLNIVAIFVYVNTVKTRFLLEHYEKAWNCIRKKFYKDCPDIVNDLDLRKHFHPMMNRALFSTHKSAQYLLYLAFFSLDFIGFWLIYRLFIIPSILLAIIIFLIQQVIFVFQLYVVLIPHIDSNRIRNNGSPNSDNPNA